MIHDLGKSSERIVGEIGRSEPVGEMALLGEGTRAATAIAIRDSELLVIPPDVFDRLVVNHPREAMQLMQVMAVRMKDAYETGPRLMLPNCITVIPANREVPLDAYCERLSQALTGLPGSKAVLNSRNLPQETGGGLDPRQLAHWLDEQEFQYEKLVLQSDFDLTPWTESCLRHADLVLVVGRAGTDPHAGPIERELEKLCEPAARPQVDLVLLEESAPFRGTAEWLKVRSVRRHYHVRLESSADRERGRRLLSGRDVTLVLGGGGARGFAHIGVLRAFEELGIPVDRVGGTSMGAIVGGLVAMGFGWEQIRDKMRTSFARGGSLRSRILPLISVDSGKHYVRILQSLFGDTRIEDLPINYFCVSCNLTRAQSVIHREGTLVKWVGASMSVPGVAPPLAVDGDLLVDGGLLNNLPADIARADGTGLVIGVDVSPEIDLRVDPDFAGHPSPVDVLRSWISARADNETAKPFPGLFTLLSRTTTLSGVHRKDALKKMTDVYLKLPVNTYKMFDWKQLDELVEVGYQSGLEQLRTAGFDRGSAGN